MLEGGREFEAREGFVITDFINKFAFGVIACYVKYFDISVNAKKLLLFGQGSNDF